MRIYTPTGDLPFVTTAFPDRQRQFSLLVPAHEDLTATIETALASSDDLMDVLLAKDVLDANGYITSLDIRYLHGARMDRRIILAQPFTLAVVARVLMGAGFRQIRILDPHSMTACTLLRAMSVLPVAAVARVLQTYHPSDVVIITPDAGAGSRVMALTAGHGLYHAQGQKHRDPKTGKLSGFSVNHHELIRGHRCLMVDDICDGGGTFAGLAEQLCAAGATGVDLFVTHGIFSKGLPIAGVDHIYTTDSLPQCQPAGQTYLTVLPVNMAEMK